MSYHERETPQENDRELVSLGAALVEALSDSKPLLRLGKVVQASADSLRKAVDERNSAHEQRAIAWVRRNRAEFVAEATLRTTVHDANRTTDDDDHGIISRGELDSFCALPVAQQVKALRALENKSDSKEHAKSIRKAHEALKAQDKKYSAAIRGEARAVVKGRLDIMKLGSGCGIEWLKLEEPLCLTLVSDSEIAGGIKTNGTWKRDLKLTLHRPDEEKEVTIKAGDGTVKFENLSSAQIIYPLDSGWEKSGVNDEGLVDLNSEDIGAFNDVLVGAVKGEFLYAIEDGKSLVLKLAKVRASNPRKTTSVPHKA